MHHSCPADAGTMEAFSAHTTVGDHGLGRMDRQHGDWYFVLAVSPGIH
jgi:hypothetical protein